LQSRIDQLAQQVSPTTEPGAPRFTPAAGAPSIAGSFPRSFLIPGTDVSLRIGGQAVGSVLWYIKGYAPGAALNSTGSFSEIYTDGQGGTGNLPSIPLSKVAPATLAGLPTNPATGPGSVVGFAHSRSSQWEFSGRQSNIFLDARVPSAWGEIAAFVSTDFLASNTNAILNNNEGSTNGYILRLREGYVRWGGLLAGQTIGTFVDNDSSPELLDNGGQTGIPFVARTPQVRYTYLLPMGMSVAASAEQPTASGVGPNGSFFEDTNQVPTASSCSAVVTPAPTATNITNACLGNAAFFNPLQQLMPNFVQRWRIDQPWGHVQIGAQEILTTLNDGLFLNSKQYMGYGASFSGNTFPGWFGWSKDNITYGLAAGNGIGDGIANCQSIATNFGGALAGDTVNATNSTSQFTTNRKAYDAAVLARTIPCYSARIGYTHWWSDNLRSNVDFSMNHQDVASQLIGASGAATGNKELDLTHLNLIWSPAAFLDIGLEGAWGHRQVVSNVRGDAYTMQTSMKFRF
jgi:hypothetical protein